MESAFRCPTTSQCPEDGVRSVASRKNLEMFSKNRASHREEVNSCSYSLYDHTQELQKTGTKIFCQSCKQAKRKELATKCVACDTDIAMCNSWLISALAGGFQEVSQKKTNMVSSRSDPAIVKEDWINDLLERALTLLARRGESFTLSESCEELKGTSYYLEAIHTMDQEDIRGLTPQPGGGSGTLNFILLYSKGK
jgi:hypothetical protein